MMLGLHWSTDWPIEHISNTVMEPQCNTDCSVQTKRIWYWSYSGALTAHLNNCLILSWNHNITRITRYRQSRYDAGPILERRLSDCKRTWTHDGFQYRAFCFTCSKRSWKHTGTRCKILMWFSHGETILVPLSVPQRKNRWTTPVL